jgi:DNA primase
LVGWQNRWLDDSLPKYTNTRDFPKKTTLWGYDFASKITQPPVIVESVPTALFLLSEGYSSIATFGANVSEVQASLLKIFQAGIILAPDNDKAGEQWTNRLTKWLWRFVPISITDLVDGAGSDLGDLVSDPELVHKLIDEA